MTIKSAKRSKRERNGTHAWHSYYAGYSEDFVNSALHHLELTPDTLVLDPWCGSGMTNLQCQKQKIPVIGIDINPIMANFSAAKCNSALQHHIQHKETFDYIVKHLEENSFSEKIPLSAKGIMGKSLYSLSRQYIKTIENLNTPTPKYNGNIKKALKGNTSPFNPSTSFYLSVGFHAIRKLSGFGKSSNPTWFKKSETPPRVTKRQFIDTLHNSCSYLRQTLHQENIPKMRYETSASLSGDSRCLPIRRSSIDAVITSPPYLTRIDYAMSTQPEFLASGLWDDLNQIRKDTMGAPVILQRDPPKEEFVGPKVFLLLEKIKNHDSKAAAGYYYKNIYQYFDDAVRSLLEIKRVLKPDGRALVVVQSSYFKDIEIPLAELYVDMAENIGLSASVLSSEKVKTHMAQVNSKSSEYVRRKTYFESVVEIHKV